MTSPQPPFKPLHFYPVSPGLPPPLPPPSPLPPGLHDSFHLLFPPFRTPCLPTPSPPPRTFTPVSPLPSSPPPGLHARLQPLPLRRPAGRSVLHLVSPPQAPLTEWDGPVRPKHSIDVKKKGACRWPSSVPLPNPHIFGDHFVWSMFRTNGDITMKMRCTHLRWTRPLIRPLSSPPGDLTPGVSCIWLFWFVVVLFFSLLLLDIFFSFCFFCVTE